MIGSSNTAKEVPALSSTLVDVIGSDIENLYVVLSALPTQTSPDRRVKNFVVASDVVPTSMSFILIWATAAVFERGT